MIVGLVPAMALLAGCASTANVDYDQRYDFSRLQTISIEKPAAAATSDSRINSPLVIQRLDDAIRRNLAARGYRVKNENADATLRYQLGSRSGIESYNSGVSIGYGRFSRRYGFGVGYDFPLYDTASYEDSVLIIDITGTDGQLLWRGSDSRRLVDGQTPEKLDLLVNELVGSTLANFPPGQHRK